MDPGFERCRFERYLLVVQGLSVSLGFRAYGLFSRVEALVAQNAGLSVEIVHFAVHSWVLRLFYSNSLSFPVFLFLSPVAVCLRRLVQLLVGGWSAMP